VQLVAQVEEYLHEYNEESKSPMALVMFLDAVEHVSRISRVLRQPQGNALLLGVGGSGRQSLTKLASFMADMRLFQIEISKGYGQSACARPAGQLQAGRADGVGADGRLNLMGASDCD
jgi:dynein heavy chain